MIFGHPSPVAETPGQPEMPFSMFRGKLKIGELELECHVLNDGRRVMTQGEVVRVLTGGTDSSNLARYVCANPLLDQDLIGGQTSFHAGVAPPDCSIFCHVFVMRSFLLSRAGGTLKRCPSARRFNSRRPASGHGVFRGWTLFLLSPSRAVLVVSGSTPPGHARRVGARLAPRLSRISLRIRMGTAIYGSCCARCASRLLAS